MMTDNGLGKLGAALLNRKNALLLILPLGLLVLAGSVAGGDDVDDIDANPNGSVQAEPPPPWGELGKGYRVYGPFIYPGTSAVFEWDEKISGKSNRDKNDADVGVYYGELAGEVADEELWAQLISNVEGSSERPESGQANWAYAIAGPGWQTTIVASAGLYKMGSFLPPKTIYRTANCEKTVACEGNIDLAYWKFICTAKMHLQAACTAASTPLGDWSVATAAGQLNLDAWDDALQIVDITRSHAVVNYSDDWFERQSSSMHAFNHPFISAYIDADGNRQLRYGISGSPTVTPVSASEGDVQDVWGLSTPEHVSEIDRFVRVTISIDKTWEAKGRSPYVVFSSRGSVFVEQDGGSIESPAGGAGGEWSQALATQKAIPSAYRERKLIRIYLQQKDSNGNWVEVSGTTNWVSASSVPSTGPDEEEIPEQNTRNIEITETETGGNPLFILDRVTRIVYEDADTNAPIENIVRDSYNPDAMGDTSSETYNNVRVVRVYQKERNKEFLDDGYWE
ncbi:MAG: hypothetical protein L3J82_08790, partial [Planctomycetes bacterium]|nr:hypothetical protein [Planctomycetota bacterium]